VLRIVVDRGVWFALR